MGHQNRNVYQEKITSANTDTQIFTSPWRIQRRYIITKMVLTNENAAVATVKFYDKAIGETVPPTTGDSVNAPLLEIIVPIGTTFKLSSLECPNIPFISGMVGNSSVTNVHVCVEIEED